MMMLINKLMTIERCFINIRRTMMCTSFEDRLYSNIYECMCLSEVLEVHLLSFIKYFSYAFYYSFHTFEWNSSFKIELLLCQCKCHSITSEMVSQ